MTEDDLRRLLDEIVRDATGVRVPLDDNFFDAGLTSESLARVHHALTTRLGRELPIEALFRYPNRRLLAQHLVSGADEASGSVRGGTPDGRGRAGSGAPSVAQARRDLRARIRNRGR
ncbi:acyl carrier protein [Plantactinospora sp. WMMB782]|uniref:acyl carrier protein n=1 Tax=Plantactinospora sp. WMMB782 TaxID=3404121 RepID=UPI003B949902